MDESEAEEEAARRYVRFARAAYRNAARTPVSVPPDAAARAAATALPAGTPRPCSAPARPHGAATAAAPGSTTTSTPEPCGARRTRAGTASRDGGSNGGADEGRWIRRDGRVILLGMTRPLDGQTGGETDGHQHHQHRPDRERSDRPDVPAGPDQAIRHARNDGPRRRPPPGRTAAIERFLHTGRHELRVQIGDFLDWLHGDGQTATPAEQQRRFVLIRLQFNVVLAQFDLFTEVVTQRSEHSTGVWLSGLDILAQDALRVGAFDDGDARLVVYLARGAGAAIRRAKTRLPGGKPNPVGIIRLPRERMVGSGIASAWRTR